MDDQDCRQIIGRHASSISPSVSFEVSVHRAHASADAGHQQNAVRLVVTGAGQHADYLLLSSDSRELAGRLLAAADVIAAPELAPAGPASPRADDRYLKLGLPGCLEPVGIHPERFGEAAIIVLSHRAHVHPDDWHRETTISMQLSPGTWRKAGRITMSADDARELVRGPLRNSLLLVGYVPPVPREIRTEDDRFELAGELTVSDKTLIRVDVHAGHDDDEEEDCRLTFIDLWFQLGSRQPQYADISLTPPEVARLAGTLERAIAIAEQHTRD